MKIWGLILVATGVVCLLAEGLFSLDSASSLADMTAVASGAFLLALARERARDRF